jgi:DNA-binding NarL/FixJ family response regulator
MKTEPIHVVIVDDHPVYSEGMRQLLESYKDIKVLFTALNGLDLMAQLKAQQPDIILMDLDMDQMDGEEAYGLVSLKYPHISVIINTAHFNSSFVIRFLRKQVPGIISKTWPIQKIVDSVRSVYHHGHYFDDTISLIMKKNITESANTEVQSNRDDLGLNIQELQVLKLMCVYCPTLQIADKLNRSPKTIDWNRNSIWRKTGVKSGNIPELILWALQHDVLTII